MLLQLIPSSLRGFMSSVCQRSQNTLWSVIIMSALSVGFHVYVDVLLQI